MIKQMTAVGACAMALTACASAPKTIAFDPAAVASLNQRTLVPVMQEAPIFMPMRPEGAAFGAIGAIAMMAEGEGYAQRNGIVDPSLALEAHLTERMQAIYHLPAADSLNMRGAVAGTPYPTDASRLYVDAKVYNWGYIYFPFAWDRYKVNYSVMIHLVDGATGGVVGQYNCVKTSHDKADDAPKLGDLHLNGAALMNQLLTTMADECAAEFEAAVLNGAAG